MKTKVRKFHVQPTRSFEIAPQREQYESDLDHQLDCEQYAKEWRQQYECCDSNCQNPDCPQHYPQP